MSSFGGALKKAGILSEAEAKRAAHEERLARKSSSPEERTSAEIERAETEQKLAAEREAATERDRGMQKAQAEAREWVTRAREMVQREAWPADRVRGNRRWHYVDESGQIPFLMVNDEVSRGLEDGDLALTKEGRVINRKVALEVTRQDAVRLGFWNS